jgi:hypothetical protein
MLLEIRRRWRGMTPRGGSGNATFPWFFPIVSGPIGPALDKLGFGGGAELILEGDFLFLHPDDRLLKHLFRAETLVD